MRPHDRRHVRDLSAAFALGFAAAAAAAAAPAPLGGGAHADDDCPAGVTVVLGGDVLLGRGVAARAHAEGRDEGWDAVLAPLGEALGGADLAIANLESPLAECLPGGTVARPRLCGDPRAAPALAAAGLDAVTLANNHALDAGREGLARTAAALRRAGVRPLGLAAARTGTPRAERLGAVTVVAASATRAPHEPGASVSIASPEAIARAVGRARRRPPHRPVLVLLHAGRERSAAPQPRDARYAEAAAGAGAAAVVMHGAHVVRPLVRWDDVPVHLGLGNLLFDQRAPATRTGALLTLRLRPGRPARVERVTRVRDGAPFTPETSRRPPSASSDRARPRWR